MLIDCDHQEGDGDVVALISGVLLIQTESRDGSRLLHSNIRDLQKSQVYKFVDLPFVEQ